MTSLPEWWKELRGISIGPKENSRRRKKRGGGQ
jgi:hypothetical protein